MTADEFKAERTKFEKEKCEACKGTGLNDYTWGAHTIKVSCGRCDDFQRRLDLFCRGFFNPKYVMPRYWHAVYLRDLKPNSASKLSFERQSKLIEVSQQDSEKGMAIFGPASTGKTTIITALYAKVLYNECMTADMKPGYRLPVRKLTSKVMLDQAQAYAMRHTYEEEVPEPDVTPDKIMRCFEQGSQYSLFLEEIDKVRETEARRANLFEILDTLHGCMGRLYITSNLTPEEFASEFGQDFMHRVNAMCHVIDLHK
jgi:hypothetical protein